MDLLIGPFLTFAPRIFGWVILALAAFFYFRKGGEEGALDKKFKILTIVSIIFYVLNAALKTVGQYYLWSKDSLTQIFLNTPLDLKIELPLLYEKLSWVFKNPKGYFIFYSFNRFWLNIFIALLVAFLFYLFLKFLKKRRERFFDDGEITLGFLTAFVAGWPAVVVFIPLAFVSVILISVIRLIFFKEAYTTLGKPFLLALLLILLFANQFAAVFGTSSLKI